ncbi:indole-3-glycerol phosphate synthase TrpC [Clostridium boliviensis]|uniref:Indole-3-glycerol phosphate synthase n=1 Tax=Clostridium boliviensis TaxID=318465 RepID=A0ABU4GKP3_9CLOT|nr:indole-3-glycerol phosphate synthase TrpC [Clostridium boliviensis]MDW2798191.1 indole-3-glycerol phosphate synthase TrpC [Clostridium boliviensis]
MILDTLAAASKKRAEEAKNVIPIDKMEEMAYTAFDAGQRESDFSFERAVSSPGISFICEVKRASPSKGMIAPDFPYREIAMEYEAAGADAVSVLTEPEYFLGKGEYLTEISRSVSLPLLRKDFTVDPYQILEAKVLCASAVLLICALLDTEKLKEYIKLCDSLGLSALVEAHDEKEIHSALSAGARLIGVNNRNLKTFEVDFENSIRLRSLVPAGTAFIAESGIQTPDDVKRLYQAGVNGVLIGESLMRSPDKKKILLEMRKAANDKF